MHGSKMSVVDENGGILEPKCDRIGVEAVSLRLLRIYKSNEVG